MHDTCANPSLTPLHPGDAGRCCALCGRRDYRLLHQWEPGHPRNSATVLLGMWQCECGLAILHPLPAQDQLPENGDWWTESRKKIFRRPRFKKIRVAFQDKLFGAARWRLVRQTMRARRGGRLLDVGCGMGWLLEAARPHYECVGLEPSPRAAGGARSRGFEVIESTMEDAAIEPESFDVVTMDAVLEHVVDPVAVLRKAHRSLRGGGVVAVKVPKLHGPSHRRHGREWNGFRVGYHTTMFTGATLDTAFRAAGLEPLQSPRRDRPLDDILLLWARKPRAAQRRSSTIGSPRLKQAA